MPAGRARLGGFERARMRGMTARPGRIPGVQPHGIVEEQRRLAPATGLRPVRETAGVTGGSTRGAGQRIHGLAIHGATFLTESETSFRRENPLIHPWPGRAQKFSLP